MNSRVRDFVGPYQTCNITLGTKRETAGSDTSLPTSEPGSPQVSYTIQSSDCPTVTGALSHTLNCIIFISGRNTSGSARTINVKGFIDGVEAITGNQSINTNQYFTAEIPFSNVSVGDVITVKIWSSGTTTTYYYSAIAVFTGSVTLCKEKEMLIDLNIPTITDFPTLASGNTPYKNGSSALYFYTMDCATGDIGAIHGSTDALTCKGFKPTDGKAFSAYWGVYKTTVTFYSNVTNTPQYLSQYLPTAINYRRSASIFD